MHEPSKILRDDRFVLSSDGVIVDAINGLQWHVNPGKQMTWDEANNWIRSLRVSGGGWRIPTLTELKSLYQNGKGINRNTNLNYMLKVV